MSSFAIKYPFFILMMCLSVIVIGIATVVDMPVDLFPEVNIPVVVVATFYSGMPPSKSKPISPTAMNASSLSAAALITSNPALYPA